METKKKKNFKRVLLKVLIGLFVAYIIFIPLCIYAEIKPKVGLTVFILFPLVLAILVVLLSKTCVYSYDAKKRAIEEKLKNRA